MPIPCRYTLYQWKVNMRTRAGDTLLALLKAAQHLASLHARDALLRAFCVGAQRALHAKRCDLYVLGAGLGRRRAVRIGWRHGEGAGGDWDDAVDDKAITPDDPPPSPSGPVGRTASGARRRIRPARLGWALSTSTTSKISTTPGPSVRRRGADSPGGLHARCVPGLRQALPLRRRGVCGDAAQCAGGHRGEHFLSASGRWSKPMISRRSVP